MNKNQSIGLAVVAIAIVIFLLWNPLGWFQTKVNPCPESPTEVIVGLPVASDSLVRMYQEGSRLKAENEALLALHDCESRVQDLEKQNCDLTNRNNELEKENAKLKVTDGKLRSEIDNLKRRGGGTQSSNYQSGGGQNVNSYNQPAQLPVTNIYSPAVAGTQEFCVNIRTDLSGRRDDSSFWPHLEADPPTSVVAEAVPNGSNTGWNIKLPPVKKIEGLYGWSENLRVIFVRADLIDKFGPTNVSMAGGMNGWPKIWPFAQKENGYYVVHY